MELTDQCPFYWESMSFHKVHLNLSRDQWFVKNVKQQTIFGLFFFKYTKSPLRINYFLLTNDCYCHFDKAMWIKMFFNCLCLNYSSGKHILNDTEDIMFGMESVRLFKILLNEQNLLLMSV